MVAKSCGIAKIDDDQLITADHFEKLQIVLKTTYNVDTQKHLQWYINSVKTKYKMSMNIYTLQYKLK